MTPAGFLAALADRVGDRLGPGILKVGIDGVDGAGKTTLADRLGEVLQARGTRVIRAGIDGFHNPREVRYARGKTSPEGFYKDSYNLEGLKRELLDPLGPRGSGRIRRAIFDHRTDQALDMPVESAGRSGVLIFDGIFLHRPELRMQWDLSIFLDVPFALSYGRMAVRDGSDPDPEAATNRRYFIGQSYYLKTVAPQRLAHVVVDYADLEKPRIVKG